MLFTRDRNFYKTLFHLMMIVVFQNIIAYSINMADNLMFGMYSQSSLSGVATVNQIQFLLQQMTLAIETVSTLRSAAIKIVDSTNKG